MINSVICGDCNDVMKTMNDGFIDLTVTSPPYDNLRSYNNDIHKTWNESIWKNIIKQLYRITKDGGVVVWVVGDSTINGSETGTSFKQALYAKEIGFNLHDTMFYKKKNPPPLNHNRYEQVIEYMFVFSKGKPKTVNLSQNPCKFAGKINKGTIRNNNSDDLSIKHGYGNPCKKTKPRNNFWEYAVGSENFNKGGKHPAIFPEKLAEDHVLSWSNENDLVFDPMCGSGTTLKMAKKHNRNYIGIELSEEYCEIARKRLKDKTSLKTFFN